MWVRYKAWRHITESQQVWAHRFGMHKYLFPRETGLCDVKNKKHLEALLSDHSLYELAYDRYGVHFNEDGVELEPVAGTTGIPEGQDTVTRSPVVEVRPKLTIQERMAKAREGRKHKMAGRRGAKP